MNIPNFPNYSITTISNLSYPFCLLVLLLPEPWEMMPSNTHTYTYTYKQLCPTQTAMIYINTLALACMLACCCRNLATTLFTAKHFNQQNTLLNPPPPPSDRATPSQPSSSIWQHCYTTAVLYLLVAVLDFWSKILNWLLSEELSHQT